jgi:Family of unknown function (DUF5677)
MNNKQKNLLKKLKKQIEKQDLFFNNYLNTDDLSIIKNNWSIYFSLINFVNILQITKDLSVLLDRGNSYADSITTRLLIERYFIFKYVLNDKTQNRFNAWILNGYKKERKMMCNILGEINNKQINEGNNGITKKYLNKKIKEVDTEIAKLNKLIIKDVTFELKIVIKELDNDKKLDNAHWLYHVAYALLSEDVHGSPRSMEYFLINMGTKISVNLERGERLELLITTLYINQDVFKTIKKLYNNIIKPLEHAAS